ncbi:uncharacterized protein BDZ99DRAFT_462894 [Mytilinidion resinicola]|uniref:Uncharacterized protein n=1 Tax=Mytilinidion resinicola TaxID=574789 RepID=A0A6A6YP29_9PEZI|nr:uncharacterized protein BDZ99DRAFT_462894 [Mytilinidion resinicola]KAF2810309.1 hypothetical protein BDZ99DRAFT_462894 [Mytilinidion resinicola]
MELICTLRRRVDGLRSRGIVPIASAFCCFLYHLLKPRSLISLSLNLKQYINTPPLIAVGNPTHLLTPRDSLP